MTYNVFWEAFDYREQPQCRSRSGVNKCVRVMAYFIAYYLPDIVCLQEIREDVQWPRLHDALLEYVPTFDAMFTWRGTHQGAAGMMTLYKKKKFRFLRQKAGDFLGRENSKTSGRPYLAVLLKWQISRPEGRDSMRDLLVVNVHMPHNGELQPQTADDCFQTLKTVLSTVPHHFLIVAGDFNRDPTRDQLRLLGLERHPFDIFGTALNSRTLQFTLKFDHIYSNLKSDYKSFNYHRVPYTLTDREETKFNEMMFTSNGVQMSDHYPVLATYPLPFNDFFSAQVYDPPPVPPLTRPDLADEMLYLVHAYCDHLPIPDPPPETWTELRLPANKKDGVYTTLITKSNYDLTWVFGYRRGYFARVFVIPLDVLNYANYHISLADQYGNMNATTTYMPWELGQAVNHIKNQCNFIRNDPTFAAERRERMLQFALNPSGDDITKPYSPFNEVVFSRPIQLRRDCYRLYSFDGVSRLLMIKDVVPPTQTRFEAPAGCELMAPTPNPQQLNPCFIPSQLMLYNGDNARFYDEMITTPQGRKAVNLYQKTLAKVCQPPGKFLNDYMIPEPDDLDQMDDDFGQFFKANLPQYVDQTVLPRMQEYADWDDFQKSGLFQEIQRGAMYEPRMQQFLVDKHIISPVPQTWMERIEKEIAPLEVEPLAEEGEQESEDQQARKRRKVEVAESAPPVYTSAAASAAAAAIAAMTPPPSPPPAGPAAMSPALPFDAVWV